MIPRSTSPPAYELAGYPGAGFRRNEVVEEPRSACQVWAAGASGMARNDAVTRRIAGEQLALDGRAGGLLTSLSMATTRNIDPEVARLRASLAAGVRHGLEGVDQVRRDLEVARAIAMIRRVVDEAPTLTPDEAARVHALLPPVRIPVPAARRRGKRVA